MDAERNFTAIVTDIRLESRAGLAARWQLALGAPTSSAKGETTGSADFSETGTIVELIAIAPSGTRLQVPVLAVVKQDGVIWHVVDKPLTEGTEVLVRTFAAESHGDLELSRN